MALTRSSSAMVSHIASFAGAVARKVSDLLSDTLSVRDFGAAVDGTTDARSAFAAASAAGPFVVPKGRYKIASSLSISSAMTMRPGSVLVIPTGVTVTLPGEFEATIGKHFECTGTGAVAFSKGVIGYAEWWGGAPDNTSVDNSTAITQAFSACSETVLLAGTYYISSTLSLNTPTRVLRGQGKASSYICIQSGSLDAIQVGPTTLPGSIGGYTGHMQFYDFAVTRNQTIIVAGSCAGIKMRGILFPVFIRVDCRDHMYGMYLNGIVHGKFHDCYHSRSTLANVTSGDIFYGWFFNGGSGIPAAGGNASVYLRDCSAGAGTIGTGVDSIGFGFAGAAADTFLLGGEVTTCKSGVIISGSQGTAQQLAGDADIHIIGLVCDGMVSGGNGILINAASISSLIHVQDCYFAPAGGATHTGINVQNSNGLISLKNNQVIGWPGTTTGLVISGSSGVDSDNLLSDCAVPVLVTASSSCRVRDQICNQNISVSGIGAVRLTTSTNRCLVAPMITGGANRMSYGVQCDSTVTLNEINATLINPYVCANNKIVHDGAVTVSGVFGSGNIQSGVAA